MHKNYFVLALLLLSVQDTLTTWPDFKEITMEGSKVTDVKGRYGIITPTSEVTRFIKRHMDMNRP